jgi:ribosomal protein S18 acetylase RimI-like enzyme
MPNELQATAAHGPKLQFRLATADDGQALGALNAQLILDEGHRNPMTVPQLVERMTAWLRGEYQAVIVESSGAIAGYALFRQEADSLSIRQIFVRAESRRQGIARTLVQWLAENAGHETPRIRIDVLVGNTAARKFWESVGFREYCLSMERELSAKP